LGSPLQLVNERTTMITTAIAENCFALIKLVLLERVPQAR
jgi:hypothetical protein